MKNLFLSFAFLCLANPAFSQFHIGLSAGGNLSYWKWYIKPIETELEFEPAMGWRTAVLGEWQMNKTLGFRAEFGTQVKANKLSDLEFSDMSSSATAREYFQYWEGSMLVHCAPFKKMNQVYLLAGGTFGRLGKAWGKVEGTEGGKFFSNRRTIDINDPLWNRNAFAADMGLGVNFPLGKYSKIKTEFRYQYSLSDLSAHDNVDAGIYPLMINVGYMHRL